MNITASGSVGVSAVVENASGAPSTSSLVFEHNGNVKGWVDENGALYSVGELSNETPVASAVSNVDDFAVYELDKLEAETFSLACVNIDGGIGGSLFSHVVWHQGFEIYGEPYEAFNEQDYSDDWGIFQWLRNY